MSNTFTPKGSDRSSFAHQDERLRAQNPLYQKADQITRHFETNRCELNAKVLAEAGMSEAQRRRVNAVELQHRIERRETFMVKRSQPRHLLRPPRTLSYGIDAQAHAQEAEHDHARALSAQPGDLQSNMMMKVFRESKKREFIARRLREQGFDVGHSNEDRDQNRSREDR